ncbi:MAG: transcriptional repressor [Chloroherpetonaceae bacterium]|nr:transcriptional repressor [Chloroherpetonaceae bacterium]MDW8438166.1 transcriptional repressor [Chloroherpetonaceae bacterium]
MPETREKVAGRRYSRQREEVLRVVRNANSHPTADWVYEQVRKTLPRVSLGTVYRNLNLLADEGLIQRVILDDGVMRYDGKTRAHHHFICSKTGKIYDVEFNLCEDLLEKFNAQTGFKATRYKIEFYGSEE